MKASVSLCLEISQSSAPIRGTDHVTSLCRNPGTVISFVPGSKISGLETNVKVYRFSVPTFSVKNKSFLPITVFKTENRIAVNVSVFRSPFYVLKKEPNVGRHRVSASLAPRF